jgi:PAS domain S-box-containing protein
MTVESEQMRDHGVRLLGPFSDLFDWHVWLLPIFLASFLIFISFHNYLLFHTAAELFAILIGVLLCVVAWQTYSFSKNSFLMYLGCGYFWVAVLDGVHTLVYKGMNIYPFTVANPATQFWIATRYLEALLLLTAPLFLDRAVAKNRTFLGFGMVAVALYALIMTGRFPDAFIEGQGLTPFKVTSEYVIIATLTGALAFLTRIRTLMEPRVFALLTVSIILTIVAELAFTFYVSVYGLSNLVGHIFKLFSFWLIFVAVVRQSLKEPYLGLEQRVEERTNDLRAEIKEHKRTEEALRESEKQRQAVFDATPMALLVTRISDGTMLWSNSLASKMFGIPHEELLGSKATDFYFDPTERERILQKLREDGEIRDYEIRGKKADGTKFWVSTAVQPVTYEREPALVVGLLDITERRQADQALREAEERNRLLLSAAGEGIYGLDLEGRTTFVNPAAARMIGWEPEDLIGKMLHDVIHHTKPDGSPYPKGECRVHAAFMDGKTHRVDDEVFWRRDGTSFPVEYASTPIFDRGKPVGTVAVFRDITERRRVAATLEQHSHDLSERVKELQCLYAISDAVGRADISTDEMFHLIANLIPPGWHYPEITCARVFWEGREFLSRGFRETEWRLASDLQAENSPAGTVEVYYLEEKPELVEGPFLAEERNLINAIAEILKRLIERKSTEDALRESEELFSKAFHASPAAISIAGIEDGFLYSVNDKWLVLLGYDREEVIGRTVGDLGLWVDFGERSVFVERLLRNGSVREFEAGFLTKGGDKRSMILAGETIELEGERRVLIVFNDITDRKRAEEMLRKSHERLADAQRIARLGHWEWGVQTGELWWSDFLFVLLGYVPEEFVPTHEIYKDHVHPDDLEAFEREIAVAFETKTLYRTDHRVISRDGTVRYVHGEAELDFDTCGNPFRMAGTVQDITERKQAEENAAEAQTRLNDAIDSISQGFALFDANDRFVLCNEKFRNGIPEACDLLVPGVPFDQIIRRRAEHHFHTEGDASAEEFVRRRMDAHRAGDAPFELRLRDGRWLQINDYRTSDGGTVVIRTDITSRKLIEQTLAQSEERFRVTAETANDSIVTTNDKGVITYWNKAAERVFGYGHDDIVGKCVTTLIPERFRSSHLEGFKRAVPAPEIDHASVPREVSGVTKDGREVPIEIAISCWEVDGQKFFTGIIRDITERKTMQAQLLQSQKMEAVGQLSGGIAHDFNNIVQIVMTNLELLRDTVDGDTTGQALLERSLAAGRRGGELTRRLLSFARKQPLDHVFLDPNDLIDEMVALMQRTLGETITIRVAPDAGCRPMLVDRSAFENAILNLALNARDAMPKGGVLSIFTRPLTVEGGGAGGLAPGNYVEIVFEDTGAGMPADVVDKAFDPFFSTKEVGKGSGLGLSMVYGFCKQSGGQAWLQSEAGTGTKIGMIFAADRRHEERGSDPEPEREEVDTARFESLRVLLVEDDYDVRESTLNILKRYSCNVTAAEDAASALRVLEKGEHFDLLLSDVVMPGTMSGFDLAKEVTRSRKDIKVLLVSGHTPEEIEKHRIEGEPFPLLRKPYTGKDLISVLVRILG